jgi:hypothetical protein
MIFYEQSSKWELKPLGCQKGKGTKTRAKKDTQHGQTPDRSRSIKSNTTPAAPMKEFASQGGLLREISLLISG